MGFKTVINYHPDGVSNGTPKAHNKPTETRKNTKNTPTATKRIPKRVHAPHPKHPEGDAGPHCQNDILTMRAQGGGRPPKGTKRTPKNEPQATKRSPKATRSIPGGDAGQ